MKFILHWLAILIFLTVGCGISLPTEPPTETEVPSESLSMKSALIYLVALGDDGRSGEKIGCGDSLVPVNMNIPDGKNTLLAAYQALFSIKEQFVEESGLYNALYQSELQVEDVQIDGGMASIHLVGVLRLGGVCDNPRVDAQLSATALQFEDVKEVQITINGAPLEVLLSEK